MNLPIEEPTPEEEIRKERIRGIIIAIVSAIMLLIFVIPILLNLYRGLRPRPTPVPLPPVEAPIS